MVQSLGVGMSLCFGVPEEWLMTRIRFTKAVQIVAEIQPIQVISGTKMGDGDSDDEYDDDDLDDDGWC